MSTVIETLVTRLGFKYDPSGIKKHDADVKASTTTLAKSERQGRTWGASMASAGKTAAAGMRTFASGVMAVSKVALTAGAVVGGVAAALVTNFASVGDEIAKTSKKVGVTTGELQRMRFAAGRSGASSEALSVAVKTLNRQMVDTAKTGTGPLADGLAAIGLEAKDLEGMDTETRFGLIAESLKKIEDPAKKSAIAMKIFGEQGTQLVPMLNEGAWGLQRLYRTAERQPDFLRPDQLENAEKLTDALSDLRAQAKGVSMQIGAALAPAVQQLSADVGEWVRNNQDFIKQDIPRYIDAVIGAMRTVAETVVDAVDQWRFLTKEAGLWAAWVEEKLPGTGETFAKVFAALSDPIGSLVALLDTVAGKIDEIAEGLGIISSKASGLRAWFGGEDAPRATVRGIGFKNETPEQAAQRLSAYSPAQLAAIMANPTASESDRTAAAAAMGSSADRTRKSQESLTRFASGAASLQDRASQVFGGLASSFASPTKPLRSGRSGGRGRGASAAAPAETGPTIDELINGLGEGGKSMRDVLDAARMGGGSGLRQTPLEGAQIVRIDASFRPNNTVTIEIPPEMLTAGMTDYAGHVAQVVKQQLDEQARQAYQHYDAAVRI